ncbi:MAG: type I polyketide synthase, partial [Planctomycetota bacterium]|nr:type I polyketide synthase [Planctomycetota bacterium]
MGGEGAAALVLKRLDDAVRDGDRVYAVVRGLGAATGGRAEAPVPDERAYREALDRALREAGVALHALGYLEAHGSAVPAEDRMELRALAESTELSMRHRSCALGSVKSDVGHAGAASGLASFVKACLCLYHEIIPPLRGHNADAEDFDPHGLFYMPYAPQYWLRDRAEGPRRAGVASFGVDGTCAFAVLEAPETHGAKAERVEVERRQPLGACSEAVFALEADNAEALGAGLRLLISRAETHGARNLEPLARAWWRDHPSDPRKNLGLSIVARTSQELFEQIGLAQRALEGRMGGEPGVPQRMKGERTFFSPDPVGGKVAFIFPGSGNHFIGMGRGLSAQWPEVPRAQDRENEWLRGQIVPSLFWNGQDDEELLEDARALIFGQVAAGTLFADLLRRFGVKPDACLGYSLGESAGFFGLRAWKARDEMYRRMRASTLFTMDLAGPCNAARKSWGLPLGEQAGWTVGIVARPAAQVRELLDGRERVYLLIVNTPQECVIGGQRAAVEAAARDLGVPLLEVSGVTVAHCDVVAEVAQSYRELHDFETTPPPGVTFYSGSWGRAYDLDRDSAAETILAHALHGLDFPQVVTLAYRDGARVFLEMGPGASCTRMVGRILGEQPHHARAACIDGLPEESTVLRMLAALVAERIPVDLAPLYGIETLCVTGAPAAEADAIVIPIGGDPFAPPPPPQKIVLPSLPPPAPEPEPAPQAPAPTPEPAAEPATERAEEQAPAPEAPKRRKRPIFEFPEDTQARPAVAPEPAAPLAPAAPVAEPEVVPEPVPEPVLASETAEAPAPVEAPVLVAAAVAEAGSEQEPAQPGLDTFPGMVALAQQITAAEQARVLAHETYLRFSEALTQSMAQNLALQLSLVERLRSGEADLPADQPAELPAVQASFVMPAAPEAPAETLPEPEPEAPATEPTAPAPAADGIPRALNREQCLAFARGKVGEVLGAAFADADAFPTRVRLPDEPLMLVDRIVSIEGEPHSMTTGRVVTEHDVLDGDWYLDQGRIPTCIAVESGQADLFLSGFLGIDYQTRGLACYRLLDAVVTFHRALPGVGEVIRYDIRIEKFFRQGSTWLFRFSFESTVNGEPLLSMTQGCAGFFTAEELAAGQGIVHTALDKREIPGKRPADWRELAPMQPETYGDEQLDALRRGDLGACFGPRFAALKIADPLRIPGGRMKLVDRIVHLDPKGGRFGLGQIRGEADIHPDDWFLTCHFVDDRVMPGTLMYECCMHTLRVYLLRMGWVCERAGVACEPVPGVASGLKCRGQVIESTKKALYEITLKEIGYGPEPYAIADALMYADGKPIVEIANMSLRMSGVTREQIEARWPKSPGLALPAASASALNRAVTYDFLLLPVFMPEKKKAVYDTDRILAFATGKPSEAFGDPYKVFDHERVIARLPGPPYQFLDRITEVRSEAWKLVPGGEIEAQYDVPQDAWYFRANRGNGMPFGVLLEIALQPCGWFSAYMGSALTSETDLSYRNLGGEATQYMAVRPDIGTLTTRVKCTKLSSSGGMIIQRFLFEVHSSSGLVYKGDTYFGFFSKTALAQQVGVRDAKIYAPGDAERMRSVRPGLYPGESPYPTDVLRMITGIDCFLPDGGPKNLGYIEGNQPVNPGAWFFKAHFYQDPVIPGSLGLESFLQLVRHVAMARWGGRVSKLQPLETPHRWTYRGQVIPTNKRVTVQAWVTHLDDRKRTLTADGFLSVDGRPIYQMNDFALRLP